MKSIVLLVVIMVVSLSGIALAGARNSVIDGDYTISLHHTESKEMTLFGVTIKSVPIPEEVPWFSQTFKVKNNKVTVNGTEVEIFNNPQVKLIFVLRGGVFWGDMPNGDRLIAVRQREASDPSWYK